MVRGDAIPELIERLRRYPKAFGFRDPDFVPAGATWMVGKDLHDAANQIEIIKAELELAKVNSRSEISAELSDLLHVQGASGTWNSSPYMHGLYNGLALAHALVEDRDPEFRTLIEYHSEPLPTPPEVAP